MKSILYINCGNLRESGLNNVVLLCFVGKVLYYQVFYGLIIISYFDDERDCKTELLAKKIF